MVACFQTKKREKLEIFQAVSQTQEWGKRERKRIENKDMQRKHVKTISSNIKIRRLSSVTLVL